MSYKFLDHTADVKFLAHGETIEKAFTSCAQALNNTIRGDIPVLEQEEKKIKINGTDLENLLYNFLEEIIVLLDSKAFLTSEVKDIKIDENSFLLTATLTGDHASKYHFTNDVKAITYSDMFIKQDSETKEWSCQAVLDV